MLQKAVGELIMWGIIIRVTFKRSLKIVFWMSCSLLPSVFFYNVLPYMYMFHSDCFFTTNWNDTGCLVSVVPISWHQCSIDIFVEGWSVHADITGIHKNVCHLHQHGVPWLITCVYWMGRILLENCQLAGHFNRAFNWVSIHYFHFQYKRDSLIFFSFLFCFI